MTKIATLMTLAACVAAALPAAAPAATDRCALKGSRTLGASEHIRVYKKGARVHICRRATGRRARFDNPPSTVRVDEVKGWRVAYVDHDPEFTSAGDEFDWVRVYDARRREIVVQSAAFSSAAAGTATGEVGKLSLLPGGVAWIARNTALAERPFEVLVRLQGRTEPAVLDRSLAIELDSLAVNARYAYWTRGGAAQGASWRG